MRRVLLLLINMMMAAGGFAQLPYDRLSNTYLRSVPERWFDDGTVGNLHCDTAVVRYTFLPIVMLKGDFGYEYSEGTVTVIMPEDAESGVSGLSNMHAKLKWRGATTNAEGKHKRNYSVKFLDENGEKQDRKLFSLRKDNHWILDGGQVDMSRVRNRVATDLWNDFSTKPYYFDKEPKALTGTRGQFVEVFLNDEYRGIYCMTECIDRSQLKLKKYTDNADGSQTIHGQLWKSVGHIFTAFGEYADYNNSSETWGGWETKYPDIEDVTPTDYSTLYDAVRFCTDSDDDEFSAHVAEYFDIDPIIDYNVFLHVLNAIDNHAKNMYWACYDSKADKRLTPAVWDLDVTVGQHYDPNKFRDEIVSADTVHEIGNWPFYRIDSLNVDGFHDKLVERYQELRQTVFNADSLTARYHKYMNMLEKCGAYSREAERWNGDSDIGGRDLDFAEEAEFISQWIHRHVEVLDGHRYLTSGIRDVTTDGHPSDRNAAYNIAGQRIASPYRGIIIRNGKKFFNL